MKKIFLAIAVLGIVSVAACSKKDADDSKKNNDTTATTPEAVAIEMESVTVPTDTFPTDSGTDVVLTTVTDAQATTIE